MEDEEDDDSDILSSKVELQLCYLLLFTITTKTSSVGGLHRTLAQE